MNTAILAWWNLIFVLPLGLGIVLTAFSLPIVGRRGARPRLAGRRTLARPARRSASKTAGREASEGVPPLLWAQCLLLWWGACGYGCNVVLGLGRPHPAALVVAALGALALSAACASLVHKLAPPPPREIGGRDMLAGLCGEASEAVSARGGAAYVRDEHGVLHSVACFCAGDGRIERGQGLFTLAWDEAREAYMVRASGLSS